MAQQPAKFICVTLWKYWKRHLEGFKTTYWQILIVNTTLHYTIVHYKGLPNQGLRKKLNAKHCTVAPYSLLKPNYLLLGLEIQFLLKFSFLTMYSKIYRPTKVDILGTREIGIFFRNSWRFFFVLYLGTLKLLLMSQKWHQSWRHHFYQAISMNGPSL